MLFYYFSHPVKSELSFSSSLYYISPWNSLLHIQPPVAVILIYVPLIFAILVQTALTAAQFPHGGRHRFFPSNLRYSKWRNGCLSLLHFKSFSHACIPTQKDTLIAYMVHSSASLHCCCSLTHAPVLLLLPSADT